MVATPAELRDAPVAGPAYLQSSPLGESVYRALGFRHVGTYTLLGRPAES